MPDRIVVSKHTEYIIVEVPVGPPLDPFSAVLEALCGRPDRRLQEAQQRQKEQCKKLAVEEPRQRAELEGAQSKRPAKTRKRRDDEVVNQAQQRIDAANETHVEDERQRDEEAKQRQLGNDRCEASLKEAAAQLKNGEAKMEVSQEAAERFPEIEAACAAADAAIQVHEASLASLATVVEWLTTEKQEVTDNHARRDHVMQFSEMQSKLEGEQRQISRFTQLTKSAKERADRKVVALKELEEWPALEAVVPAESAETEAKKRKYDDDRGKALLKEAADQLTNGAAKIEAAQQAAKSIPEIKGLPLEAACDAAEAAVMRCEASLAGLATVLEWFSAKQQVLPDNDASRNHVMQQLSEMQNKLEEEQKQIPSSAPLAKYAKELAARKAAALNKANDRQAHFTKRPQHKDDEPNENEVSAFVEDDHSFDRCEALLKEATDQFKNGEAKVAESQTAASGIIESKGSTPAAVCDAAAAAIKVHEASLADLGSLLEWFTAKQQELTDHHASRDHVMQFSEMQNKLEEGQRQISGFTQLAKSAMELAARKEAALQKANDRKARTVDRKARYMKREALNKILKASDPEVQAQSRYRVSPYRWSPSSTRPSERA